MTDRDLIYKVKGAIYDVYNELGPGLLESVYKYALLYCLNEENLLTESEVPIPLFFRGNKINQGFRADIIVNKKIIIEIKSVDEINKVHHRQLITYLKLTDIPHGILVNFNTSDIRRDICYWDLNKII